MAETPKEKNSYLKEVARFYFSPDVRSVGTLLYLGIFGYFTLYYIDNLFLAARFLFYVLLGHTALSGSGYLLSGLAFVICLVLPFFVSFYSIFVLHKIWDKPTWATHSKWLMTLLILVFSLAVILISEKGARFAARQDSMQSFIEDAGLSGKI